MQKIDFLLWRVECRIGDSVFLSLHQTSLNGFKIPGTESNFIHSSFRFGESGFDRWICICIYLCIEIFTMDQTTFISTT